MERDEIDRLATLLSSGTRSSDQSEADTFSAVVEELVTEDPPTEALRSVREQLNARYAEFIRTRSA
jgi:hypothetical protein